MVGSPFLWPLQCWEYILGLGMVVLLIHVFCFSGPVLDLGSVFGLCQELFKHMQTVIGSLVKWVLQGKVILLPLSKLPQSCRPCTSPQGLGRVWPLSKYQQSGNSRVCSSALGGKVSGLFVSLTKACA